MQINFLKLKLSKIKRILRKNKIKRKKLNNINEAKIKRTNSISEIEIKRAKKKIKNSIVLLIIGILIFFYPLISKFIYQKNLSYTIDKYVETIDKMDETEVNKKKDEYEKLNELLLKENIGKIDLLKKGEILGYIQIEKINVYLPIYEGTDDKTLNKGIGHLEKTSLPIKNYAYHSVFVGHTGISTKKFFDDLPSMKIGDEFIVTILNESFKYKIYEIKKVLPNQTKDLRVLENRKLVTLVTCTPKFVNSHRLLVMGEIV